MRLCRTRSALKSRFSPGWLLGAALIILQGCSGGGGPTSVSVFIPDINNIWSERGNPDHTFSFTPARNGQESSTFTGEEGLDGASNPLDGAYNGREIHFTIKRAAADVGYQGQFTDKDTMDLSSSAGRLVITRNKT